MANSPKRVLFAGYAPVHFLCFQPIYEHLRQDSDVEVRLSGGLRTEDEGNPYDAEGLYGPLGVDPGAVLPFDQAREQSFDVTVCSHTSDTLLPKQPGRTVQIFHGVSFKNFAVREKVLSFDVLCIPGRYHEKRFRDQDLLRSSDTTYLLTGFPKADRLCADDFERESFVRALDLDPARPTILFAPTGGKNNALETVGEEVIESIREDGRWNLLIKPHDHPKRAIDWFAKLSSKEGDRVRLVRDLDVIDYLRASDLLLTDASSVAVEYTLLDRPIVFIDVPKLLLNVLRRGAPLDLETYGREIGRLARTATEVVPQIGAALQDPAAESGLRRKMANEVFHDPGGAARRTAGVIRWAAGLQGELPTDVVQLSP